MLIQHRFADSIPSESGPIELGWSDGTFTTLDANADWTLDLTSKPWTDPYAGAGADERQELADEVGLWEPTTATGDLNILVGRSVTSVGPILNEAGELSGLELAFGDWLLLAAVEAGNLAVHVSRESD
ncbi:hypothetical protein ACT8ZV_06085 [Nocardioides sp. MAHUQ-72]|uniref:hypothetical protein n=1 Tax=unclassified Nocardioides TaxID=2615069 RepID=UPI00361A0918